MVSPPIGHFWSRSWTETRRTNTIWPLHHYCPICPFPLTVKVHTHWLLVFLSIEDKTKNMSNSKECQGRRKKLEYCLGFLFREKYRGVFFALLYCEIFITIHVHSSGWSCSLFFPLTLVLIEVKKPFHSSSAVCFPPFRYYLVCRCLLFQYFEITLFTVLCFK